MSQRPRRARQLGIVPGDLPTGPHNAITDVTGVHIGHTTIVRGTDIRTGVTAVVPTQLVDRWTLPAALSVGNGYGKLVGSTQLAELGVIETPIVLTATLSVFRAADALVTYMLGLPGRDETRSVNPIVGETNDGYLSDVRARPVRERHVLAALHNAAPGLPAEGAVGAGTGTAALGYKAGIGTASRTVVVGGASDRRQPVTVGALVQANFSGVLTVCGVPIPAGPVPGGGGEPVAAVGNSCMIVAATDARLDSRQLGRLARRGIFAMARVGADFAGGSGDYALAFSTADAGAPTVPDAELDPMFAAIGDAVEEALLNSLFMTTTTVGFAGHVRYAVPPERVLELLRAHGRLPDAASRRQQRR